MNMIHGVILAVMGAMAFGTMPILARVAYNSTGAVTVVFLRFCLAACLLLAFFMVRGVSIKITGPQLTKAAFLGAVGHAGTSLTLFSAFQYIDVGPAMILHFVYPSIVALLALIIYKERLSLLKVLGLVMSLAGIYCLLGGGMHQLNVIGVSLALGSGMFFAVNALEIGRGQTKNINNTVLTFYISLFAALGSLGYGLIANDLDFWIDAPGWAAITALGLAGTVFAIGAFSLAARIIGSSKTAILNTFEPLTSVVLGALLLQEKMTGMMILGGSLIIMAAVLFCLPQKEIGACSHEGVEIKAKT